MDSSGSQLASLAPSLLLSSPKRDYRKGEEVIVTVGLANFTPRPLVVNKRLQMIFDYEYLEAYELGFQIIGPRGTPIAPRMVTEDRLWPYPQPDDFVELLIGAQWQKEIPLSLYFDLSESGSYEIIAKYHNSHNGHQFGFDAWTGELRSPPVEVVISEHRF